MKSEVTQSREEKPQTPTKSSRLKALIAWRPVGCQIRVSAAGMLAGDVAALTYTSLDPGQTLHLMQLLLES